MTDFAARPPRLQHALQLIQQLAAREIYFFPVRHHSPACAYAVLQALREIQPAHILIEGPSSFNRLIADLQHADSRPPLAVLCQTEIRPVPADSAQPEAEAEAAKQYRTAYFPFCEYSPEWVALREAPALQAGVEFIDLDWSSQVEHEQQASAQQTWQSRSLQQERYLAHSQYIQLLARKLHCRNHDELWEHLFELQPRERLQAWQAFFEEVFVWCAMSRLDYEPAVLQAEASLIREQRMLQGILARCQDRQGPLCIVTGGFHTLALVEELADQLLNPKPKKTAQLKSREQSDQSWLIRYSFDRLDALNGYASGMPSPAFYQRCWEQLLQDEPDEAAARQHLAVNFISEFSAQLHQQQITDSSFITVKTASEQAIGLAALRGHAQLSRFDVIDACFSSFIKGSLDEGQQAFRQVLHQLLSGAALGQAAQSAQTPPLLAQVYELAKFHRFKLEETLSKRAKLDVLRNPKHRLRSRFLHLLDFLELDFAKRLSGPDFLGGGQLNLLFEEWDYAWTPQVEANLIELAEYGSEMSGIALQKLLRLKQDFAQQGLGRSSHQAVQLLIRAALMGLQPQIPVLFAELERFLPEDPDLDSVLQCGQKLLYLWTGKDFLAFQQQPALKTLLQQAVSSALFLVSQWAAPPLEQQRQYLQHLLQLHGLIKQTAYLLENEAGGLSLFHSTVARLTPGWTQASLLLGGVSALQFMDGVCTEQELHQRLQQRFGIGADPEQAVNYLSGIMHSAPELLLRYPAMADLLNELVQTWDEAVFVALLPDLRFAFTHFKPKETAAFAEQIAQINGVSSLQIAHYSSEISQEQLLQGVQLNQQLNFLIAEQQLEHWLAAAEQGGQS
ncbi:hypothetical protein BEN74_04285 [Acinetobacter sp. WCHAc010034]|uniref:DUF5682 family protein n=1 Tax=Acinetobacter sp. WCHAc010034 TaxID=1879049 RepID=UPI00083B64EB|nr:DUF5682 family protein [Acinetobacter sp. WCHAc010034]AYA02162.1 hypothetical protein BEN74_04285 [Acinetobacter sp. WCHAc010034]